MRQKSGFRWACSSETGRIMGVHAVFALTITAAIFIPGLALAAGASGDDLTMTEKLCLLGAIALAITGLALSRARKIVVFANLTDMFATLAVPVTGFLIYALMAFLSLPAGLPVLAGMACGFLVVCWATWLYNQSAGSGFFGSLLSIYTKFFLVLILFLAVLLVLCFTTRDKYERNRTIRNAATAAGIVGVLAWMGLWNRNLVSLSAYLRGK